MKKGGLVRYDLDKVYYMNEYKRALSYGKQNLCVAGVKEQLQSLENAKERYFDNVASIVNPEREREEAKFHQYQKWAKTEKKCVRIEIILILVCILNIVLEGKIPVWFRASLLYSLFDILLTFGVIFAGPIAVIASKLIKHGCSTRYGSYIEPISNRLDDLGNNFTRASIDYYMAIDNLYLQSLDSTHRELILLRRQQEETNQEMIRLERERQRAEEERLKEQQKARQATEELLAIERERERRYREW